MTVATTNPPAETLARLIERYGARAVLAALLRAFAARSRVRRAARLEARALNTHLRRDLGLPPVEPVARHYRELL
jgi:hypothetical protein